ncbi:chromosomal replication initiator DnaA [Caulobacter sp. 602-1]|uniref:DnaA regulatory inactivator HdaA n=1 Tax=Caulobacter sp. 602-1 TaxID=2492472 RepID=UPI000F63FE2B|nr:chromosomal replication initiator DnaA [Caulobacter sp. 602-1]RRN64151.1 chromosomal replication initiator DnaA [Caulobacter sp. 602-1]
MSTQFRLPLTAAPRYGREDFAVSGCNADAVARLDAWPNWPEGRLALVGPVGVGKTHLARTWARAADAVVIDAPHGGGVDLPALRGRAILVEDADQRSASAALSDEDLFHILNMAGVDGGSVLLTARVAPIAWSSSVPDLRSRLNALTVAEIDEPDDVVLRAVLERAFRAEHLKPDPDLYPYLIARLPRSAAEALAAAKLLDEAASQQHRAVNKALAREVLGDLEGEED